MKVIRSNANGLNYLTGLLKDGARVITKVAFWKIPHNSDVEDINLKIGRYNKGKFFNQETLECENPKSELTLDNGEFQNLIKFISENYLPLKDGVKRYIPVNAEFDSKLAQELKEIFEHEDKDQVLKFIQEHDFMPEHVQKAVQFYYRIKAIEEFESHLQGNLKEYAWQDWFKKNDWVLGSEFVRVLDERSIDTHNIADYLMEAYDGFLDIIEIKRPEGTLEFWSKQRDHGNVVPHMDLVKAITQATNYIYEIEREMNSVKFLSRVDQVPVVKPRCVLIFGRSDTWNEDERMAYRILNCSYHNLSILTYDHVLHRARRILGIEKEQNAQPDITARVVVPANPEPAYSSDTNLPF